VSFEDIYRTHFEFVWRTLRRMGVNERDIKDGGQKVFLIAFQRLADFEGRSSLKTWLCGIALRVASDYRRSAIARHEVLVDETPRAIGAEVCQLELLERHERLAELDAVLSELPLDQRTVLVLFELEEMSGDDIANLLGVAEGTVRSRLRLGRQNFSRVVAARRAGSADVAAGGDG